MRVWPVLILGSVHCGGRSEPPPSTSTPTRPGPVVRFEETFDTAVNVEPITSAVVADGVARGPIVDLPEPGGGTAALVVSGDADLAPGVHVLQSLEIRGSTTVAGDLTLDLAGPLEVASGATLIVEGDLAVVVGGAVSVQGEVEVRGAMELAQPTGAGIALVGGVLRSVATEDARGLRIDTRGGLSLDRSTIETRGEAPATPELLVRAYGDVALANQSTLQAGSPSGDRGIVTLRTEGSLVADDGSVVGGQGPGGTTVIRVGGDIALTDGAFLDAGGRRLDVIVAGDLEANAGSGLRCRTDEEGPCDLLVTAANVVLADASIATDDSSFDRAGSISISTSGDTRATGAASVRAGDGYCADGGSIELRTGGAIDVASVRVGTGFGPSGGGCRPGQSRTGASGNLVAAAAGAVDLGIVQGGGEPTILEQVDLAIRVDTGLWPDVELRSIGLPTEIPNPTVLAASATTIGDLAAPIVVDISGNGTEGDFVPLDLATGRRLLPGWRYRATIPSRMFDSPALDTIVVEYQ